MKKPYKIVSGASTPNRRELADWLAKDGQLLIPLVELLEKGRASHRRGDRRDGPGDHRGRPADERRAGGGARRSRDGATPTGICTGTGCRRDVWH